jgi:hypothetical protein
MKNIIKIAGATVLALALTQNIQAIPIVGNIGFTGQVTLNSSTPATATEVTSWVLPTVNGTSGVFAAPNPFAVAYGTAVSMAAPWSFVSGAVNNFWVVGGFTFNLTSSSIISQGGTSPNTGFVVVDGTGIVSGNGYTPTAMTWSFSVSDPEANNEIPTWTIQASSASVPDGGATVMLLGIALSGVALLRKKLTA